MKIDFYQIVISIGLLLLTLTGYTQAQSNAFIKHKGEIHHLNLTRPDSSGWFIYYLDNYKSQSITDTLLQMDSILFTSLNGTASKVSFTYNTENKMSSQLIQDLNGSSWENSILDLYFYNSDNKLIQDLSLGWSTSEWDSLDKINYYYDSEGNMYQSILQAYDGSGWMNVSRITNFYDSASNDTLSLSESWQDTSWQNSFISHHFYSNQNRMDSLLYQSWNFDHWENFSKTIFYYDEQTTFLDSLIAYSWNSNNWQYFLKLIIQNDNAGNQIRQTEQLWNGTNWENSVRRIYSYNEFNYVRNVYCQIWTGSNWIDGDDVIFIENHDGYKIAFSGVHEAYVFYNQVTSVNNDFLSKNLNFRLEQNYPNPFNPSTKIKFSIPESPLPGGDGRGGLQLIKLAVYDLLGNEVATLVNKELPAGNYEIEFNAANLPSGVYFYQLTAGSPKGQAFSQTKKMILLR